MFLDNLILNLSIERKLVLDQFLSIQDNLDHRLRNMELRIQDKELKFRIDSKHCIEKHIFLILRSHELNLQNLNSQDNKVHNLQSIQYKDHHKSISYIQQHYISSILQVQSFHFKIHRIHLDKSIHRYSL